MILKSVRDYLVDPADTSAGAVAFRAPAIISNITVVDRNDARRELRAIVGDAIFAQRRPAKTSKPSAITLRVISSATEMETVGEHDTAETVIQADCWTSGGAAALRGVVLSTLLRLSLSGCRDEIWSGIQIYDISQARETMATENPSADGRWQFVTSLDLRVIHSQPAAAY